MAQHENSRGIPLARGWPRRVKSTMLNVIALAQYGEAVIRVVKRHPFDAARQRFGGTARHGHGGIIPGRRASLPTQMATIRSWRGLRRLQMAGRRERASQHVESGSLHRSTARRAENHRIAANAVESGCSPFA